MMTRKQLGSGGVLAGVALGGVAFWLIRRARRDGQATEPARSRSSPDSWLPDDILDVPADSSVLRGDALLADIFDRPRH
jgi:hypothetical protein